MTTARPHPVRILAAIVVLSLPTGWMASAGLPAWLAVPGTLLLVVAPLWSALIRDRDEGDPLPGVARSVIVLLATLGICATAGVTVAATGWIMAAVVAMVLLGAGAPAAVGRPSAWTIAGILVVLGLVVWRPLGLLLSSDAPGHVAGILDAIEAGSLLPPDRFPGATGSDPRFGVLHGFYAIVAGWTGASAGEVLRWAALVLSPLWLVAHATLMRGLGLGPRVALLTAVLFTMHAGAGRAFGLGASAFPGSVAQSLCAFALALLILGRGRALAVGLLGLSALVHPFAWWSTTIVLFVTAVLHFGDGRRARTWLAHALVSLVAGTLVLIPRLAARGEAEGLHSQLQEVVFVGGGLFVADPFWIFRWGGTGSVLALPALLLVLLLARRWWRRTGHRVGLALAVPVWLISLNPFLAPLAWPAVSYLVVRLGRIVLTTWVWTTMIGEGITRLRHGPRGLAAGILLGGLGLWGITAEISIAWMHLHQPQVADGAHTAERLDELAARIGTFDVDWLLAAPRIGYGIRARGGPPLVLTPVAHASPNDRHLLDRLARWRELHDPGLTGEELRSRLATFGDAALLVDARTRELHDGVRPYGYLPDAGRSAALDARLRELGFELLAEGDRWSVFRIQGEASPGARTETGRGFSVDSLSPVDLEARVGETVPVELVLRATGQTTRTPHRVFIRLEGDMPEVPGFARAFSKLWRKLVIERSGRSHHRFGQWVAPADLVVPPSRWPDGTWRQEVGLRIPAWASPGTYTVQVTTHEWSWHPSYELRDYLSDRDGFSATPVATLKITD